MRRTCFGRGGTRRQRLFRNPRQRAGDRSGAIAAETETHAAENAGNQYTDGCYTGEPANTTADPDYTLTDAEQTLSLSGYGSAGALEDENMTLADMLTYAIQDEYLARAEYELIISEYGNVRPFTNNHARRGNAYRRAPAVV